MLTNIIRVLLHQGVIKLKIGKKINKIGRIFKERKTKLNLSKFVISVHKNIHDNFKVSIERKKHLYHLCKAAMYLRISELIPYTVKV